MSSEETSGNQELVEISALTLDSRNVNVVAKVASKREARVVSGRGGTHRVADALVGDATASIVLTLWDDNIDLVSEGDTVKIANGYVNLFRGNMRLNVGRYGKLEVLGESPIEEVNTENNLSEKMYEQQRRPYGSRDRGRRGYRRRRY